MSFKADLQAAFAICAAIIGAGFASGREIASFFAGLGSASYLGVTAASCTVGGLVYVILRLSRRTQANSFPELYGALMGTGCRDAMHILYALLCLTASAAMLSAGAHLGELTFDFRFSRLLGLFFTLCCSVLSVCSGMNSLGLLGSLLVPLTALYYLAMALRGRYSLEFAVETLPVTLPMGILYASFNAALAGGAICLTAKEDISPKRTALLTGGMMLVLLVCADTALLRAGDEIQKASLPSVVLSAQWGLFGYYTSILVMWLAVLTTLCALLHSLRAQFALRFSSAAALILSSLGSLALSVCGFDALVDTGYPILGWICCCALLALVLFLPEGNKLSTLPPHTDSR